VRKLALLCCVAVATSVFVPSLASAGGSGKKPPVKLDGKVNRKGTATVKDGTIAVEARDFFFKATFLKAKPGETVTVDLSNKGQASHTFTIDGTDVDSELDADGTATVEVQVPDKGPLVFYCRFHEGQGMQGAFFTKKGQKVRPVSSSGSSPGTTDSPPPSTASSGGGIYSY
jgi:plastocyanin